MDSANRNVYISQKKLEYHKLNESGLVKTILLI